MICAYRSLIEQREARLPLSHIVGYRDFWKHRFEITPDVLDPRPETEILIELALQASYSKVLDLGTGSGCIVISLLDERPQARGTGTDTSDRAILVARRNAEQLGVADRLSVRSSDWFHDVVGRYDLIVSNPPYISVSEMNCLEPEVREHEPRAALTDERDGLTAYHAIAQGAPDHLLPGGRLLVEIGPAQARPVTAIFQVAGFLDVTIHRDLDQRDRVVSARFPV
jgi:release factor glutamine methyltransferase